MFRKLMTVKSPALILLGMMIVMSGINIYVTVTGAIEPSKYQYYVQPFMAIILGVTTYAIARFSKDRIRHKGEKMVIIASVIAIWFVIYFLSGFLLTYVRNTLVASPLSVLLNIFAFGVTAFAVEYARYKSMLLAGRRNIVWFGVIVAIVFGLQQINVSQFVGLESLEELIKVIVSDGVPAMAASILLTYIAVVAGFGTQLVYRLGIVAITIFPPIIPKYDWYMLGLSWLLLAVAIYIVVDRNIQGSGTNRSHYYHHMRRSSSVMWFATMVALVLFMTGVLTYKPLAIVSNSMKPIYSRGDIVIVQKVSDVMAVEVGDIVQYNAKGIMITHRVKRIDFADDGSGKRVYITQGDNSPSEDPIVQSWQIVGIVRAKVPYIGYPTVWLREAIK